MYSLHLWKGVGEEFSIRDGFGRPLRLQVVGLLKNSIFQGDLLMSERDLLTHFPEVSGYQFFLVDSPAVDQKQVQQALQLSLGDFGFIAEPALDRLADYLIVQNTYLTTFQSLGGLGLLLGTFGLATVQLRNVLERRSELALMRATGWRSGLLARLILYENGAILLGGLLIGICAALVAVLPHLLQGGAGIPWRSLAGTLGLVAIVGLLAGWLAARSALRADLIATLRAES
jgi:putative ABC transport system permease protein